MKSDCDAKFKCGNLFLGNVDVIIVIVILVHCTIATSDARGASDRLSIHVYIGCIQKQNRLLRTHWALAFDWPIFLDLMEYANQIQKFTERSVSGYASGCTHRIAYKYRALVKNYIFCWSKMSGESEKAKEHALHRFRLLSMYSTCL